MSLEAEPRDEYDFPRLMRGMAVQKRVLVALIIRMLMTKYGRHNIGFLWIVLEPMILCTGVLVVRSMMQGGEENGIPLVALLTTGYLPLTLWRHISSAGCFMFRRSAPLLYHRDITLIDCAIAIFVMELGGCSLAATIVYFTLYSLNLINPIYDFGLVLVGWISMGVLAAGLMMVFAVMTEMYEATERFVQPFQYLMIPICGFFFMLNWFPNKVREMAWFVPTIHCYEMIRAGVFGPSVPTYYDIWYTWIWALGMLFYAVPKVEKARGTLHFA